MTGTKNTTGNKVDMTTTSADENAAKKTASWKAATTKAVAGVTTASREATAKKTTAGVTAASGKAAAKKAAAEKTAVGKAGEELAAGFLKGRGHTIVERNFRKRSGEIDIISIDEKGIHFVEVKTRRPPAMSAPAEAVNATKQHRIVSAAGRWLSIHGKDIVGDSECFFDIVGVMFKADGNTEIEYIQQAFVPTYV